jgi:hypothetical protein
MVGGNRGLKEGIYKLRHASIPMRNPTDALSGPFIICCEY